MAVYHFSWDLSWFALVDWPVDRGFGWRLFAAAIATSFLALVGVSLVLAHEGGIRWRPALRRIARVALAAGAISLVTWLALGDQFVRFGILHAIALGSLIALPFVAVPPAVTALAGLIVLALPLGLRVSFPGDAWFGWTGLVASPPLSVDFVPVFPWLGVILLAVAATRVFRDGPAWRSLAAWRARGRIAGLAALAGRHSLLVYLLHQPILFGSVWAVVALGLAPDRTEQTFVETCAMSCSVAAEPGICERACQCTLDALKADGTWTRLLDAPDDPALNARLSDAYGLCRTEIGPARE